MLSHPHFWRIVFLVFVVVALVAFLDVALIHGSSCESPNHYYGERTWWGACR